MEDSPRQLNHNNPRRAFLKAAVGSVGLGVASYVYAHAEPDWVEVERVALELPRLPEAFDGYRIAQVSDIHMDGWMTRDRLSNIVKRVNALKPDLVALTGDFVSYKPQKFVEGLADALGRLRPKDGAFAVLGNHDHWTKPRLVRETLKKAGVEELNNAAHALRRGGARLHLAGVDDTWSGKPDLEATVRQAPGTSACILLAHEPDYADESAKTGRFDLQLSGHSHGGQVCAPFFGPIILPKYARKYPSGLYHVGGMKLYTNRGVGMVGPHVRFNCRPEITLFTLKMPRISN